MNDQSKMSCQATSRDSSNATSSQVSGAGRRPCASPDGPMLDPHGQDHALANLSARQAREKGLLTSGIYGLLGITSSGSASLQSSLESRLKARFDMDGSILFKMTWKDSVTPSGHRVCLLRASGRRTSDNDFGSWPTVSASDTRSYSKKAVEDWLAGKTQNQHNLDLNLASELASWPTPAARDWKDGKQQNVPINALLGRTAWACSFLAPTANTGQLNPRLSGWLMGYPIAWDLCAMRIPEKRSSTRSSKKAKPDSE